MNKLVFIVVALLLCVSIEGVAQSLLPDFHRYARFAGRATGFVMKKPAGFEVVRQGQDACWTPEERKAGGVTPFTTICCCLKTRNVWPFIRMSRL